MSIAACLGLRIIFSYNLLSPTVSKVYFWRLFITIFNRAKRSKANRALRNVEVYHQLQILVAQINLSSRKFVLPALIFDLLWANCLCTYITIAVSSDVFANVGNAIFPVVAVEIPIAILGCIQWQLLTTSQLSRKQSNQLHLLRSNSEAIIWKFQLHWSWWFFASGIPSDFYLWTSTNTYQVRRTK